MNQLQKAEQFENNIKALAFDLAKQLGTTSGFMEYYIRILYRCKTHAQAFEIVNMLHFLIFKEYKYTDLNSFKRSKSHYFKK